MRFALVEHSSGGCMSKRILKKILITTVSMLFALQNKAMAANDDQITQLDSQRNETLNKITTGLIEGKISPGAARQLKVELDDVTKLESHAQEDHQVTPSEIDNIATCLDKVQSHISSATHATKVWSGIDSHDKTLHDKIADALAVGTINKEQATTLEQEYEKLRNREVSGYPINAMEFTEAIAIADDLQALNDKINQLITGTGSIH